MKRLLAVFLVLMPLLALAAGKAPIFFPDEAAGGKITLWGDGARIFTGGGWAAGPAGRVDLPLKWEDKKDRHRMFMRVWSFEVPEGRFILGAERKDEKITFTLTREGEKEALLRSEPFTIETFQDVEAKSRREANQSAQTRSLARPV